MIMFLITLAFSGDLLKHEFSLGGDELARPVDLWVHKESFWILDQQLFEVIQFDRQNRIISRFGQEGQGPGELNNPSAIFVNDDFVYIYDFGKLHKFDHAGQFIDQQNLKPATLAHFSESGMLAMHTPFGKDLFSVFDLKGQRLRSYGNGMDNRVIINNAHKFIYVHLLHGNELFWLLKSGGDISKLNLDQPEETAKTLTTTTAWDLYRKKNSFSQTEENTFQLTGLPVNSLFKYNRYVCLLLDDETSDDRFILVLNEIGKQIKRAKTEKPYSLGIARGEHVFLFDLYDAVIDAYTVNVEWN